MSAHVIQCNCIGISEKQKLIWELKIVAGKVMRYSGCAIVIDKQNSFHHKFTSKNESDSCCDIWWQRDVSVVMSLGKAKFMQFPKIKYWINEWIG